MILITNGVQTLMVTNGAYECMYRDAGFYPLSSSSRGSDTGLGEFPPVPPLTDLGDSTQHDEDEDDEYSYDDEDGEDEIVDYSEFPLSELGYDQLCEYADQLNINRDGIRSKKELRALIRQHRES